MDVSPQSPRPGRQTLSLVLALLLLNASLTFRNIWPTPAFWWAGDLSLELALALAVLLLVTHRGRPAGRLVVALLTTAWTLLVFGRYADVTTPALLGRSINLYWDDRYAREKIKGDLERLTSFYMDQGYGNFAVTSTQVSVTPDKEEVYVTINIAEGELCGFCRDDRRVRSDHQPAVGRLTGPRQQHQLSPESRGTCRLDRCRAPSGAPHRRGFRRPLCATADGR